MMTHALKGAFQLDPIFLVMFAQNQRFQVCWPHIAPIALFCCTSYESTEYLVQINIEGFLI